jgi:hypothetical protein
MDGDFMELEPELIEAEVRHSFKRIFFSMLRIFDAMCSKPEIFLAFLSKSNYSRIIVSTKLFGIFETMSGN